MTTESVMPAGRPVGSIVQYAYTVPDVETAVDRYVEAFGVGPWYIRGPFTPASARYRGAPSSPRLTLARAFAGDSMIELIQQHDDGPSVYRETVAERGHGFHHWAVGSVDVAADVARWVDGGGTVAFEDVNPSGARIVYIDTGGELPGMVEIIEMTPSMQESYRRLHASSLDWDGTRPKRYEEP